MSEETEKKMKDELEKLPLIKLDFTVPYDFFFFPLDQSLIVRLENILKV